MLLTAHIDHQVACLTCGVLSVRVHSRHHHDVRDLPIAEPTGDPQVVLAGPVK